MKAEYAPLCEKRARLCRVLDDRQRHENLRAEEEVTIRKMEKEEQLRRQIQQQEKEMWEERMRAELVLAEKKIQMEKEAKASTSKLPELKISPFNGTSADWIRFENMFASQVDSKSISDAEKFGYLLELVNPKVRGRLSNLKPGSEGYKTAWERLKIEYGHNKLVIAAHMEEIIKLQTVRGRNYDKVCEFYESLCKNYDALQTLGEEAMLKGLVVSTLNKLPQVKPDLVRIDDDWEDWNMKQLLSALQGWLKRNKTEEVPTKEHENPRKKERNWYTQKGGEFTNGKGKGPVCIYCEGQHWGDQCTSYDSVTKRRQFFVEKRLCFNCGRPGHRESKCRSRGCYKCKGKHHTSLCDKLQENNNRENHNAMLNGYSPSSEEKSLPAIVPLKIKGKTFWAYLDTGSGRNFISKEAVRQLRLSPQRHESRNILTVNGSKKASMPVFEVTINSVDGQASENIEITGTEMPDFTTVKRPTFIELKEKYEHLREKTFYRSESEEYPIHVILGDATYCKIRTDQVYKGKSEDPIVEGTTFGWVVHGGQDYADSRCMYVCDHNDYEQLYSLDVLGVEDRGEKDQSTVYAEFQESITRKEDGRYEVAVPWIPGAVLSNTNEEPSRKRLHNVNRKLKQNQQLKDEYEKIVHEQLKDGVIEKTKESSTSERVFYMPHKPVIKENASTTKVRMVFDASARPHPTANSVNECMHTGPPLQPLLWDILIRARMSTHLLLADLQKAFLQVGLKEDDRDAFRFLFDINGQVEHLRFTRVPFGVESSPFMLGATLQHHFNLQPEEYQNTIESLKENTYVDNLMKTGSDIADLEDFKREATEILEDAKFPVHKWESNVEELDNESNPSKILDKMEKDGWFNGPEWLVNPDKWPKQPKLERTKTVLDEQKPMTEVAFNTQEKGPDEWDLLLSRSSYWKTIRVTAWALRFVSNYARARKQKTNLAKGPLTTNELEQSKVRWVKKVQEDMSSELRAPGWEVIREGDSGLLKCKGRIPGYQPIYLEGGDFTDKLIMHTHNEIRHFGIANTMAALRENWWIPRLRSKVKRIINECNVCKAYRVQPYGRTATAELPTFRIESDRPFETTGVDFAGPLTYKLTKKEEGKCYILIFTCATSRAVHLELTKTQSAEEFKVKLNAFIARKSRPKLIVSDNGGAFKATALWIRKIRKSERLQDYLARQEIRWRFNLSKSPWWGGMYERLLKDIKKALYKVLGRSTLCFDQLQAIVIDIEKNVNNRPLTYVESEQEEEQVLTPNTILWGQNVHTIDESDTDDGEEVVKLHKRMKQKREHAWQRWKTEYVHSLMEHHRVIKGENACPEVGEMMLVVGEEKNRAEWKRGKVVELIKGKDNVVRGVKILTKGHTIERPLTCLLSRTQGNRD